MTISLIAAVANNRVIGNEGGIPWDIPADRHRFRELTMGHPVIMGRKTFESIGHPLAGRRTIIVTRQPDYRADGCDVSPSLAEALGLCSDADELFIAGGGELYQQALPFAGRLYLTIVGIETPGDTLFPELPEGEFVEETRELLSQAPLATLIVYRRVSGR
jgi:dihydrofolate reductase